MNKFARAVLITILLFSVYHLIRDALQTLGFDSAFTNILHWQHRWCASYCGIVTYPLDILGIVGSYLVLKRNRMGYLGVLTLASLPLWLLVLLLP